MNESYRDAEADDMSSPDDHGAAPPDPPNAADSTGTFPQYALSVNDSGTARQLDGFAHISSTLTFERSFTGPLPTAQSRQELLHLVHRSKEGIAPPLVSGYKLVRELGSGAYGTVWEAENNDTKERVAIKFFVTTRDDTNQVLEEVTNLREADGCYGIITVKQVNRHGIAPHHIPNYVMALETGGSLQSHIEEGKLSFAESLRLFRQICQAMAFVHSRGLLHCDLKPANILLNKANEPVIADFGQAQRTESTTTTFGTFFFMAPEQATRQPRTPRTQSDVYSLGAILYTLVVGKPPRHDDRLLKKLRNLTNVDDILEAYREGLKEVPHPTAHQAKCDPLLTKLIDRCLELNADNRPTDASDIVRALKHRDWWQRAKPIITIGSFATLVFILLLISLSVAAANYVLKRSKDDITREIQGSLTRDAWFARKTAESMFHERIEFLEDSSLRCPPDVRTKLTQLSKKVAERSLRSQDIEDRERLQFEDWLLSRHTELLLREGKNDWRSVALLLVSDGRGYFLNRVNPKGQFDRFSDPSIAKVHSRCWSFRDYFNGVRNDYENQEKPHEPIRHTHISHAYQSKSAGQPWLVDVATPIFENQDDPTSRVVALLVSGFRLDNDLHQWIEAPTDEFPMEMVIASQVRTVLVNDRGHWVWHEDGMARMARESDSPRDPEPYLMETVNGERRFPTTNGIGDSLKRDYSAIHHDRVRTTRENSPRSSIAAYDVVSPYAKSRYPELHEKSWYLIVQLDSNTALQPVDELKRKMQWAGSILFLGLFALTLALWYWLIRLLRRQEFSSYG